jgi:hypothetical protein
MPDRSLAARVENLERRVELLKALPERVSSVELQIVHLRGEMRGQFSAARHELEEIRAELRTEIQAGDAETRRYMRVLHEEVLSRIAIIQEGLARRPKR